MKTNDLLNGNNYLKPYNYKIAILDMITVQKILKQLPKKYVNINMQ